MEGMSQRWMAANVEYKKVLLTCTNKTFFRDLEK